MTGVAPVPTVRSANLRPSDCVVAPDGRIVGSTGGPLGEGEGLGEADATGAAEGATVVEGDAALTGDFAGSGTCEPVVTQPTAATVAAEIKPSCSQVR